MEYLQKLAHFCGNITTTSHYRLWSTDECGIFFPFVNFGCGKVYIPVN